jgi:hypothetical protein
MAYKYVLGWFSNNQDLLEFDSVVVHLEFPAVPMARLLAVWLGVLFRFGLS